MCERQCALECVLSVHTRDGAPTDLCNNVECCFDRGEYASSMLLHTLSAQWHLLKGDSAQV